MKTYFTFGQSHAHSVNGKTLDKDCVAVINASSERAARELAFQLFDGGKFCFSYPEETFNFDNMKYYPRGLIELN